MFVPPTREKPDPRILGTGTSKMVWQIRPTDDFAVINAYDDQRAALLPVSWTPEEIIDYSNKKIIREYEFTQYVRKLFGDLIPKVYPFRSGMFQDNKFRYAKELCEPVVKDNSLFYEMVHIAEEVLDKGWVYLDMKPGNLGIRNGKTCIIDTDPTSFYRFPPEMKSYFVLCSYMIILLISRNYAPYISESTLLRFIQDKQLHLAQFAQTYRTTPPLKQLAEYGNQFIDLHLTTVMHPRDFFDAYGTYKGKGPLHVLKQLIDLTVSNPVPMPVTPDVLPPATPSESKPETKSEIRYVFKPISVTSKKYPRNPKLSPVLSPVMSPPYMSPVSPEKTPYMTPEMEKVRKPSIFNSLFKRMPKIRFKFRFTRGKGPKGQKNKTGSRGRRKPTKKRFPSF